MNPNELLVFYGTRYKEMTKAILKEACLDQLIPAKEARIGIKPNLVNRSLPAQGAITHPEVLDGVIEYLQEHGFYNLAVMEGSWVGERTEDAFGCSGYAPVLSAHGVPFLDMQKDKSRETDCAGMKLRICEEALAVDFLINLPVLKGHCQTRMTCALKNMKGLIPNSEKRRFHRMGLHDPIAHLNTALMQDFILVDSICGDLTMEDGGNPVQQDRLIAGRDPVLVDTYGCSLMGLDPETVSYIPKAERLGVGSMKLDPEQVRVYRELRGDAASQMRYLPDNKEDPGSRLQSGGFGRVMALAEKVEEVESCSACYGYLIPALDMLEKEGLLGQLQERICIGQGYRGKTGKLGVGNCTAHFEHTLEGCPPTENQMYAFLKQYIGSSEQ